MSNFKEYLFMGELALVLVVCVIFVLCFVAWYNAGIGSGY